jgi:hypothetical protein
MLQSELEKKSQNIPWGYSSKPVSAWGGMRMMKELIDNSGIKKKLKELPLPYPKSNRGYDPISVIESFWVCVWLGGARFSHTALLRFDEVLKTIFDWKRVASVSTYTRFFNKFNRPMVDSIFAPLNKWFFSQIPIKTFTLDLDSSVVTRYGEQEGSKRGYNPQKKGRNSHHPLMAFISDIRMVANAWLRPGDTSASNNVYEFFKETIHIIGADKIGLVRGDSGFFGNKFFTFLESHSKKYITAAKSNAILKQQILTIKHWLTVDEGIQISEFNYKARSWNKERRILVVKQSIGKRPKALGKNLFKDLPEYCGYRYQQYATNLDLPAVEIWRLYRGRADSENRIKELKYEFGMNGFCLNKFYATEAAFRMVVIAYNLLSLFRQAILKQIVQPRLSTIRFKCFALGSWIVKRGRKKILKLSVNMKRRAWLDGLFSKLVDLGPPFPVKIKS